MEGIACDCITNADGKREDCFVCPQGDKAMTQSTEAFEKWKAGIPEKEYFDSRDEIKGWIPRLAFEAGQRIQRERDAEIAKQTNPIHGDSIAYAILDGGRYE